MGDREVVLEIERIDRLAKKRGNRLYGIYLKLTPKYQRIADKILNEIITGKTTYREALKKLREIYKQQLKEKQGKHKKKTGRKKKTQRSRKH